MNPELPDRQAAMNRFTVSSVAFLFASKQGACDVLGRSLSNFDQ